MSYLHQQRKEVSDVGKQKRRTMPYKKDQAYFKHTAVRTKKINVNPYPARGGYRI